MKNQTAKNETSGTIVVVVVFLLTFAIIGGTLYAAIQFNQIFRP
ncbi:MAG TPA: hypothetical protein VJH05_00765 [Candidatus Paceibacterota bacterium]